MPQFARPATRNSVTTRYRCPPPSTASSNAYLARNGGASAITVASSRVSTERIACPRCGITNRFKVANRRRV
jgi:hypothetical protein